MARPIKEGLDYYPKDTDIYSDRKIRRILKEFGCKGTTVYDYLLCVIYRDKGYYVQYSDELCFDVADFLESGISEDLVKEVVKACLRVGLFDTTLFEQCAVLTSFGIQSRYIKIKRNAVIATEMRVIGAETEVIATESTQRKEKKRKENIDVDVGAPPVKSFPNGLMHVDLLKEKIFFDKEFLREFVQKGLQPEKFHDWLCAFNRRLQHDGETQKTEREYRRHFGNWIVSVLPWCKEPTNYSPVNELKTNGTNRFSTTKEHSAATVFDKP